MVHLLGMVTGRSHKLYVRRIKAATLSGLGEPKCSLCHGPISKTQPAGRNMVLEVIYVGSSETPESVMEEQRREKTEQQK